MIPWKLHPCSYPTHSHILQSQKPCKNEGEWCNLQSAKSQIKAREISFINQVFYLTEPWRGGIYLAWSLTATIDNKRRNVCSHHYAALDQTTPDPEPTENYPWKFIQSWLSWVWNIFKLAAHKKLFPWPWKIEDYQCLGNNKNIDSTIILGQKWSCVFA